MFYDEVEIYVKSGDGGNGAVAFRREKFVPYGGPSGGDGGKGGDVVLVVNPHLNTLYAFTNQREFIAPNGEHGRNKDQFGAGGANLVIQVPSGTVITNAETGEFLVDLTQPGQEFVVVRGGKGGRGNKRFATSTNQAPEIAENGDPGEARRLKLELKLLADVGLVGKPNAGKSTLLAVTTAAKPKIAPYPFTTLQPQLGVVALGRDETFVMTDLPGLIEGASEGKGLGLEFLRHIERTRVLIHVLDATAPDPLGDFATINAEMVSFGHGLADKPQLVAINKLDMPEGRERFPALKAAIGAQGYEVFGISGLTREAVRSLMGRTYQLVQETPIPETQSAPTPPAPGGIITPPPVEEDFSIAQAAAGIWVVSGGKVERAVLRTNLNYFDGLLRLHAYLEHQGVIKALRDAGVQEGDIVRIGEYELEWRDEE